MNVRKTDCFISDLEAQYVWYTATAGEEVADRFLETVEATCRLLGRHPGLGPLGGFAHARLCEWRYFLAFRPFNQHLLFYEVVEDEVIFRRAMHGRRDLPHRLLQPPATE